MTLHRLTHFENEEVFQQVTEYFGRIEEKAGAGRFFRVTGGIVGLACRTGRFVVVKKTDPQNFEEVWQLTQLESTGAKAIKPYVDSLLACPFFAARRDGGDRYVLAVLFVDSAEADLSTKRWSKRSPRAAEVSWIYSKVSRDPARLSP